MHATIPTSHHELLDRPLHCVLSTLAPSGHPQSTVLWFGFLDGTVTLSVVESRKKIRNLQANPACTFLLHDPDNAFNAIEIRGNARLEPDSDRSVLARIVANYGRTVESMPPGDRVVVAIDPVHINVIPPPGGFPGHNDQSAEKE